MTFEDTLSALEALYIKTIEKSLTPLEQNILRSAWEQQSYSTLAKQLYITEGHIKDVAAGLWKNLSSILGVKVTKRTFRGLVEQQSSPSTLKLASRLSDSRQSSINWADAPDLSIFLGRQTELQTLEEWIVEERCRVVTLVGMGGIGKTALAARLGQRIQEQFEFVIWRSLINAPLLTDILQELTCFLSRQKEIEISLSLDQQLLKLLNAFRQSRCLLILDNVETILAGGKSLTYCPDYENYDQLFRRLGEATHQSCLLLTSREKPPAIVRLESPLHPVRSLLLSGLKYSEARQILEFFPALKATTSQWQRLIELYQGHPLALELVAKHIDEIFFGDVGAFLEQGQPILGDIQLLLDWHIQRLSPAEIAVLYRFAIHREPLSLVELKANILEEKQRAVLPYTLQSLKRHIPLVESHQRFALQPVLLEHVSEQFIEQMSQAIMQGDLKKLDQFSFLQASAQDYLRQTQVRVIVQPILQRCQANLEAKKTLYQQLFYLLNLLKTSSFKGYASGNIINLMVILDIKLSRQNFSKLTIREANLKGCQLWETDFSETHFDRVAFTQAIKGVMAVDLSIEVNRIAASDSDGVIHLYEIGANQPCLTLKGHQSQTWIYSIAFSPDGLTLISGGLDKTLRLWDSQTGKLLKCWILDHEVLAVAYHPDGVHFVSTSSDANLYIWQIDTEQPIAVLRGHQSWVWAVAFSSDGTWLVSSDDQGIIRVWDSLTGTTHQVLHGHLGRVQAIAISPDDQLIASAGDDYTVKLWDSQTGVLRTTLEGHHNIVRSVGFHREQAWLASTGYDGIIKLWDLTSYQCLKNLHSKGTNRLDALAFGSQGDYLVAGSKDQNLQLWDVSSGKCIQSLQGFVCGTASLALSPNGRFLASSGLDHFVWLWDVETGQCLKQFKGHHSNVWTVAISPEGRILASGSYDQTLKLWDMESGKLLYTCNGHRHFIRSVTFSPTGEQIATASSDRTLKLWETRTGECLRTFQGHRGKVQNVLFTNDGQQLVSCGNDGMIQIWDIATGQIVRSLIGEGDKIYAIALHPDASYLVSGGSDAMLKLWNLKTGEYLATWKGHQSWIWSVAFSPDGNQIASCSNDQTVRFWDINTGNCQQVLQHTAPVGALVFSPDGKQLICGCFNEYIYIYQTQTRNLLKTLRIPGLYEGMNLQGATGLSPTQLTTLRNLGARI